MFPALLDFDRAAPFEDCGLTERAQVLPARPAVRLDVTIYPQPITKNDNPVAALSGSLLAHVAAARAFLGTEICQAMEGSQRRIAITFSPSASRGPLDGP